ncbi:MAG: hypothetical protein H0X66_06405 [Verrucomicrobia bacterium]|nr:hypothetical protein [Verrucomicrobiota bacterium]
MKRNFSGRSRWMVVDDEEDSSWLIQYMLSVGKLGGLVAHRQRVWKTEL